MAKLPKEPDREKLRRVRPEVYVLKRGARLWRIYSRADRHPTRWNAMRRFGPVAGNRFDHHSPPPRLQKRGIMYLAANGVTCLAERFQRKRTIDVAMDEPWLVGFRLKRAVRLHSLRKLWPTRTGASMEINSGRRDHARNWSRAIYEEYGDAVEGLYYGSSMHGGKPAIALYERAADAIPEAPEFHRALNDPDILHLVKNAGRELWYVVVDGKDVLWSPSP